jgi:glycosyltransferase involved in cell wall biosynthesis
MKDESVLVQNPAFHPGEPGGDGTARARGLEGSHCPGGAGAAATGREGAVRPLRVLHVIPQLSSGGAERFVLTLMRTLDADVCTTKLCVLGSVNRFPERAEFIEPTEFLHYGGSSKDIAGLWRCVRRVRQMIRTWRADIVHSHLWPAARVAALALRGTGARHVVHIQDTRPWVATNDLRSKLTRFMTGQVLPGSRPEYVAVSRAARDYNCGPLGIAPEEVEVIPNAVDTGEFHPGESGRRTSGRLRIGVSARLSAEKGHIHLLRAFKMIVERGIDAELLLAGEGGLRESLEALSREQGIGERVQFLGLVRDMPEFLRSLDVSVLPSVEAEGMPLTILEAMATGLPVLVTDVAGAMEVIEPEVNGLIVPPGDAAALAGSLRRLTEDADLRRKLGRVAAATAREQYSFDAIARQVEVVYRRRRGAMA